MNKEHCWADIINHYTNKGYIINGLTLPFLIGSYNYSNTENLISLEEIISNLLNYEKPITLMLCPNIDEYIFNIMDLETFKVKKYFRQLDNIYITDGSLKDIKDVNELISFLDLRYYDVLEQNLFSKDDITLKWRELDNEEIDRLKEVFS